MRIKVFACFAMAVTLGLYAFCYPQVPTAGGAYVPSNGPMPNYFSATNCRASALVVPHAGPVGFQN